MTDEAASPRRRRHDRRHDDPQIRAEDDLRNCKNVRDGSSDYVQTMTHGARIPYVGSLTRMDAGEDMIVSVGYRASV
jgi:hypothetical protein